MKRAQPKEPAMHARTLVMGLSLLLLLAAAPDAATAQEGGGLIVRSAPPGAVVELVGEYVFRGVTPWTLDRGLSGRYEVRAYKSGYEEWDGYVLLSSTRRDSLTIRLSRKTPLGAGLRSAIVPGWGQYYTDQGVKGTLFLTAEIAALSVVLWANEKRDDAH
ncbi:MAG: PEGA domain-containing protein, partial [Candidatus Eisenbacteria bacterium]|nr:PEGA domain-containing protein [Candidatus Eisenbacteria bacterium]